MLCCARHYIQPRFPTERQHGGPYHAPTILDPLRLEEPETLKRLRSKTNTPLTPPPSLRIGVRPLDPSQEAIEPGDDTDERMTQGHPSGADTRGKPPPLATTRRFISIQTSLGAKSYSGVRILYESSSTTDTRPPAGRNKPSRQVHKLPTDQKPEETSPLLTKGEKTQGEGTQGELRNHP